MMPSRIRVVGSLNIDFTTTTPRFPQPGETVTAKSLHVNAGGKGANQAVACGRAAFSTTTKQDVSVEMVGAVGANDPYYASLLQPTLEESGVDCTGIKEIHGSQTGTATIIVDEGANGENRILVVPGANHDGMSDLSEVLDRAMREPLPDVVVLQGEIPKGVVLDIISEFKKSSPKTHIVFNPAPVFVDGIPSDTLGSVSVLIVNESELLLVASHLGDFLLSQSNLHDSIRVEDLERLTRVIHNTGVQLIIVTLGGKGAYYSTIEHTHELVQGIRVENVKDTTAAGDTFVGYFSVELVRHSSNSLNLKDFKVKEAVSKANSAAARSIQKSGAIKSIPWGYECS